MKTWLAVFGLLVTVSAPALQTSTPDAAPAQASVRFAFDWPQGFPWQKYSILVQANGKTHFDGTPNPRDSGDTDAFQQDFTMSEANRQKMFELAQKLNYFRGDLDSHLKHIAQTGRKTLEYRSPQIQGAATYNWSQNPDVEELTKLFMGIATTIDYGRKLAFQYRFDKLGMDQRLKELEDLQVSHNVEELEVLAPILRKIANDPNLMNISRQSAQHLLKAVDQTGAAAAQNPGQP